MASRGRFNGKVAIVTGGCNGIGRGIAEVLAENGGKVAVLDIDDEVGKDMRTDGSGELAYIRCDVTDEDQVKNALEETLKRYGKLDCLVNNAGWHPPAKTIDEFTTDEFRQLIDLNLIGYFMTCKYSLPHLRQTRGSIVNISSSAAPCGQSKAVTYCATKGGITAMSKALAIDEAEHQVRVNSISPGACNTPLIQKWAEESNRPADVLYHFCLQRRLGETKEVGETVLFLATAGTFITGQDINVNGGTPGY